MPNARAGRFHPGQPDQPKVPGYSCAHCGCLVVHRRGHFAVHAWNRSVFCDIRHRDFRWAKVYEGA